MVSVNIPFFFFFLFNFFFLFLVKEISCHGRLMDPPARNSMWRLGYPNPTNFDDNQLWCGGHAVQFGQNGGKCGICGDAWHLQPRPHEAGGEYANGLITRRYTPGQTIEIEAELTTNHKGTFEVRMCTNNDPKKLITQDCLDEHLLKVVHEDGKLSDHFRIPENSKSSETFYFKVKLPSFVTCTQCVIQWKYRTENTWGVCPNGTEAVGCGDQETFINCADVTIQSNTGGHGPIHGPKNRDHPFQIYYRDHTKHGNPLTPLVVRSQVCVGTGTYKSVPGIDDWCQRNCLTYPPNCPSDKCKCLETCEGVGSFKEEKGSREYCRATCLVYPSKCASDKCACH